MTRRSSSPEIPVPEGAPHATRRRGGGSRREATERVSLRREETELAGWTLNISRGGARLVLEDRAELGSIYKIEFADRAERREIRIVWVQDEADGQIVGVQFLDGEGSVPPPEAQPELPKRA